MTALTPENKWTLDGTKEGVTVHSTYDPSGLAMSRGEGVVDVPAEDLAEYLYDEKYLGEYDSSLEVNEAIATIDDKTTVAWELTKKITFVSQRDFLYVCRIIEKDGSIYLIAKSIDWPAKPPASGHVRAELRLVAWILTPIKDKPNSCHTVHIVSVDLKGSIPSAIVSRETLKQGYVTIKVRETAGAWLKKRGPRKIIVQEKKPVEEKKEVEAKKDECCAEKKEECTEKKAECCAEEKKETVEKKDACCAEKKEESTEKKAEYLKRGEKYYKEATNKAAQVVAEKRKARASGAYFVPDEPKVYLVVRIRGINNLSPVVRKILQLLRLRQLHNATFVRVSKATTNMLRKVEPFITYGYPSQKLISQLIYKRGFAKVNGQRVPLANNEIIEQSLGKQGLISMEDLVHEITTCGPHFKAANNFLWPFKLTSPRKGYTAKRHPYHNSGDWGNRETEINELVQRML